MQVDWDQNISSWRGIHTVSGSEHKPIYLVINLMKQKAQPVFFPNNFSLYFVIKYPPYKNIHSCTYFTIYVVKCSWYWDISALWPNFDIELIPWEQYSNEGHIYLLLTTSCNFQVLTESGAASQSHLQSHWSILHLATKPASQLLLTFFFLINKNSYSLY